LILSRLFFFFLFNFSFCFSNLAAKLAAAAAAAAAKSFSFDKFYHHLIFNINYFRNIRFVVDTIGIGEFYFLNMKIP
jgi:hypothetical protein